jgi:hypothetical protein
MVFIGPISSIFDYATYAMMLFIFDAWSNPSLFQTGWFVESLLTQTLIIHIIRTARTPFIESHASPAMIATTVIICLIGIALPFTPGRRRARLRAAAHPLLAAGRCHDAELCGAYASGKGVVRAPLGDVRRLRCGSPASLRAASSGCAVVLVKPVEVAQPASPR